jgi:phospholipid/cholesterol/gamma-HCH transport system permease protein
VVATDALAKPVRGFGKFFAFSLDTLVQTFHLPFATREFVHQMWFVARVSLVPGILLAVPFNLITVFALNVLLIELGAADYSGVGAAVGAVTQIGPIVTLLVVAGAGATAMCADLGARTIREEVDAMRVMGLDPVQRLAVPRVLALIVNSFLLCSVLILSGLVATYFFAVYIQHVTPGAFAASLTLLLGLPDIIVVLIRGILYGLFAGLIACYKGLNVGRGAAAVGNAVNETVVFTFMTLLLINALVSTIAARVTV